MKKYIATAWFIFGLSLPAFPQYKLKLTDLHSGKSVFIQEKKQLLCLFYQVNDSMTIYRTDVVDKIDGSSIYFGKLGRLSLDPADNFSIHGIKNADRWRFVHVLPFSAFFGLLAGIVNVSVNPGFRDGPTLYIGGTGALLSIATYSLWRRHRVRHHRRVGEHVRLEVVRH